MKINGTLLISEILARHNESIINATYANSLTKETTLYEAMEYSKIIRFIMESMVGANGLQVDYSNLLKCFQDMGKCAEAQDMSNQKKGQSKAWHEAIIELNAMKGGENK